MQADVLSLPFPPSPSKNELIVIILFLAVARCDSLPSLSWRRQEVRMARFFFLPRGTWRPARRMEVIEKWNPSLFPSSR